MQNHFSLRYELKSKSFNKSPATIVFNSIQGKKCMMLEKFSVCISVADNNHWYSLICGERITMKMRFQNSYKLLDLADSRRFQSSFWFLRWSGIFDRNYLFSDGKSIHQCCCCCIYWTIFVQNPTHLHIYLVE